MFDDTLWRDRNFNVDINVILRWIATTLFIVLILGITFIGPRTATVSLRQTAEKHSSVRAPFHIARRGIAVLGHSQEGARGR
jgi:hypothetical protein